MIKGIFPPIPTPFKEGQIAFDELENNVNKWNQTEISGFVIMGSNGESPFLNSDEKISLIEKVKNFATNDKIIIAGTGLESIAETVKLTNASADVGADYALVLTPSFYGGKMNHDAQVSYFTQVADNSKIPVIIYNVPKFTGIDIESKTVAELAWHKNIVGLKNSSENMANLGEIIFYTPDDFSVLVGTASVLFPGLILGASGGIVALANIAPNECSKIYQMCQTGMYEHAKKIQLEMIGINKAITSIYGVAGLKYVLDKIGYYGGIPRTPLRELDDLSKKNLDEIIRPLVDR